MVQSVNMRKENTDAISLNHPAFQNEFNQLNRLGPAPIVRERVVSPGAQTRGANKTFTSGYQALSIHNTN